MTHEQAGYLDISPLDLGEMRDGDMVLHWKIWEWKWSLLIMKLHRHSMKLISVMVRSVKLQIALQPLRWQYVLLQKDMASCDLYAEAES